MPRYPWKTAPCVPLQNPLQQNCRRSRWSGVHCFLSWDKSIHELQDPPSAGPHQRPHCKRWTTEPAGTPSQHTSSPHLCDWDTCQCAVARGKGQGLFGCKWSVATCNPPAASGPGTHKMHSSQCLARNGERAPLKMSWELPAKQLLQWHPKNHWPPAWGSSTSRWPRPISRLQCSPGRSAWNWSRWWRRRWRGSSQRLSAKALPALEANCACKIQMRSCCVPYPYCSRPKTAYQRTPTLMVYSVMLMPNCNMEEISTLVEEEKSNEAETMPPSDSRTPMMSPAATFTPKAPQSIPLSRPEVRGTHSWEKRQRGRAKS